MNRVLILMATYNSDKYIYEQLMSFKLQEFSGIIDIQVNDDGSSDNTVQIIEDFASQFNGNITVTQVARGGHLQNFMYLLENAKDGYDYYMFSDHDDYWYSDKVDKAISALQTHNATTYGSAVMTADQKLTPLEPFRHDLVLNKYGLDRFFLTYTQGCTVAVKSKFFNTLSGLRPNLDNLLYHDLWVSLVSSVLGNIYLDNSPTMLYRIHENNALGVSNKNLFKELIVSIKSRRKIFKKKLATVNELLIVSEELLTVKQKKQLRSVIRNKFLLYRIITLLKLNYKPTGSFKKRLVKRYFFILGAL